MSEFKRAFALMDRIEFDKRREGSWDESRQKQVTTICGYCGVGCSLSLHVQRSAESSRNRGVHRAPFVVLIGANMPSALAEISFLSNPSDEQLLKKGEYRQRLAEGLYQGVVSYLQRLNSVTYNLPARNLAAGRSGSGSTSGTTAIVEQFRNQQ